MLKLSRVLKDYRQSGALNALMSVHAAIDENVFLTKGGDLLMVLKAAAVDPECFDEAPLDAIARRLESGIRIFDENFRLYQYLLKQQASPASQGNDPNPIVEHAIESRLDYLRQKDLYSIETYLVVAYEGWQHPASWGPGLTALAQGPLARISELLSSEKRIQKMGQEIERAKEQLSNKVNSFVVQLRDCMMFEILGKQRAFRFLYELLNYEPYKRAAGRLRYDSFVDFQACNSALECHRDHLRLDDFYVRVLTLKDPPVQTYAHMLRGLQEIACPCVLASEWKPQDNWRVRKFIQSKRRHFHNSKSSLLNYLNSSQTQPKDMLIDNGALAQVDDLGACLQELEVNGRSFGQFSFTAVLYAKEDGRVKKAAAELFKTFGAGDAQLTEERYNLLNAWLAVLPGNRAYNLRRLWLTNSNYADLTLLFAPQAGEPRNTHLNEEALASLETNHDTLYFLNLHHQDVAHTAIFGATGSGKSFLLNFLLTHLQKYQPLTYLFDLGGSYKVLTELFSGAYVTLRPGQQEVTINPFTLPPTPENLHFLFSFVKVLAESGGAALRAEDERDLFDQIENLYAIEPAQRRLLTLSNIVNRPLRASLQKWVQGGQYGAWFDHSEDNLTLAPFQAFDFEGMDKYPQLLEPLLFYILHRASASIDDPERATTFKTFVMDEAWRFLLHPTIRLYLIEALKTWRKKNAAMILATQSTEDLTASETLRVVIESCATKLFLANPGMDRRLCRELFALNEKEAALIGELVPKRQILVKRPDHAKVVNLNVGRKDYWLYTSDAFEAEKRRQALKEHGLSKGLDLLARSEL